jgi:hypothetical protein
MGLRPDIAQVSDSINKDTTLEGLDKSTAEALKRTYVQVKDERERLDKRLKAEKRQAKLDKEHPFAGIGRALGTAKNFYANHWVGLTSLITAVTIGVASGAYLRHHFNEQERTRPTKTVGQVFFTEGEEDPDSRDITGKDHPAVRASITTNDAVRMANRTIVDVLYEKADIDKDDLIQENEETLGKFAAAKQENTDLLLYFRPLGKHVADIRHGGRSIDIAWSYRDDPNFREECDPTYDEEGNYTGEDCYFVCDDVDHYWRFNPDRARNGISKVKSGMKDIDAAKPSPVKTIKLERRIRQYLSGDEEFNSLPPDQQQKLLDQMTDFLKSIPIKSNNDLLHAINSIQEGRVADDLGYIEDNIDDHSLFPRKHHRNTSCSASPPHPQGYRVSKRFADIAYGAGNSYAAIKKSATTTKGLIRDSESLLEMINSSLRDGSSISSLEDEFYSFEDSILKVQKAANKDSQYDMLPRKWRNALPWVVGFGSAGLLFTSMFFGIGAYRKSRRRNHFRSRYTRW